MKDNEVNVGNFTLVRVQSSFIGLTQNNDNVVLNRIESERNTMHFCINGIVAAHEFGDWDDCGIVILANPNDVNAPMSGARLEDTWYHCGKNGLDLGKAIILAPEGTKAPEGITVQHYPVGKRNEAVEGVLKKIGSVPLTIGRNGVDGVEINEYLNTCLHLAENYSKGGPAITGQHYHSFDASIENISMNGYPLNLLSMNSDEVSSKYNRISVNGVDEYLSQYVISFATETETKIKEHLLQYPNIEQHAGHYFNKKLEILENIKKETLEFEKKYKHRFSLISEDGDTISSGISEENIVALLKSSNLNPNFLSHNVLVNFGGNQENIGSVDEVFFREIQQISKAMKPPPLNFDFLRTMRIDLNTPPPIQEIPKTRPSLS